MPLYLLWGDEDFNIELRLGEIKSDALKSDVSPLNYKRHDNPPFNTLDEILRTQGLMFGDIVNVIHAERYFLNVPKKIDLDDKQIDSLIQSFENLSPNNHIVFICSVPREKTIKPDSRRKIYKAVEKYGTVEHFEAIKPYQTYKAVEWLASRARKRKLEIGKNSLEKLVQISGVNLRTLDSELDKLELMAYPNKKITDSMLDVISRDSQNAYNLVDLILEEKNADVIRELTKMIETSHYLPILSFLEAAFSNLLYTKVYSESLNSYEIARKTNQNEFIVKQNMGKIRDIDLSRIVRIKQNLVEAEYKLKTGKIQDPILAFSCALLIEETLNV